jgi:hypothetical protein
VNPFNRAQLGVGALNGACDVQVSLTGPGGFGPLIHIPRTPTEGCASDPSLAFDSNGRLFASFLGPTETGVPGPAVVLQQIDVPTGTPVDTAGVPCSSPAAQTIDCPIDITQRLGLAPGSGFDKEWITIDANPASPFRDRIYAIWGHGNFDFNGDGIGDGGSTALTAYSADRGATWTLQVLASNSPAAPPTIPNDGFMFPFTVEVAANGDVYAAYKAQQNFLDAPDRRVPDHNGYIAIYRSTTGGTFDLASRSTIPASPTANAQECVCTAAQIADGTCQNSGGVSPPSTPCPRRLNGVFATTVGIPQPWIVPDPLDPANLVVVYSDDPTPADGGANDDLDVRIARSTDFGAHWTFATVPALGDGPLQLFPNAAGLPGSRCLTVSYYNTRTSATGVNGGNLLDVFAIVSPDLGQTWLPTVRINDALFDPGLFGGDYLQPNPLPDPSTWIPTPRMGEYFGLVHAAGVAWTGHGTSSNVIYADYSDGLPPAVAAPAPVTVGSCRPAPSALGSATATDVCGMPPLSTPASNLGALLPLALGPNTVTWSASDGAGNTGSATQSVTVTDLTGPAFTVMPPDLTTSDCTTPSIGQAFAQDDCGGAVTISNNAPAQFPLGTTTVTWTARDARGNVRTATQRVTVVLGDDPVCCPAGTNIILGNSNNNVLNGTAGPDCILGRGAQDTINGGGGNDFISGGDGDDNISGGTGNDSVFGGTGQDTLNGNSGNDSLNGGDGDDRLFGGTGNDTLRGGQGQDLLQGQDGDDALFGDGGDDNLDGGNNNDTLAGGPNNDTCAGGAGVNTFAQCELGGAPNSCVDGVLNGTETATDCGGACPACDEGQVCASGGDCMSGVCSSGTCQDLPGGIHAAAVVTTDWGGGYCVTLAVTNLRSVPTVNWTLSLNTNQSTIYTSWNGSFSGSSGAVTVTPGFSWNQVIDPGETDSSIGFCANRTVPGSGLLPFVLSASGVY